jgi:protein-tyrosine-phosphatase
MLTQVNIKDLNAAIERYSAGERGVFHANEDMEATCVSVLRKIGVNIDRKKTAPEVRAARAEFLKAYHREFQEFRLLKAQANGAAPARVAAK